MSGDSKANPKLPKKETQASPDKGGVDRFIELFMNSVKTQKGKQIGEEAGTDPA